MDIRPKLLLILTALGVVPLVALSIINYQNSVGAVHAQLLNSAQREALVISWDIAGRLGEREDALTSLARSPRYGMRHPPRRLRTRPPDPPPRR